jgi:dTDP-4-dehydrorhamnose 3,5-epimerase-like enzyme
MVVDGETTDIDVAAGRVMRFRIEPGVSHAFKFLGESPGVTVTFTDREYDPTSPDTVEHLILD